MSATGHGGVTVIAGQNYGQMEPVSIPSGGSLTFTHNVGRRAYQVIVTSGNPFTYGAVLTAAQDILVAQLSANQIVVTNDSDGSALVFIACRWEENTAELDLVLSNGDAGTSDPRVVIAAPTPPL